VDELAGPKYVLRSDDGLRIVAQLETAGFNPEDLFARHLGHKVTIRGKVDSSGDVPVVTLTSAAALKMIANRCAPE
jgi:HSP20 family molecular chaperone IbpA